MNLLQHKWFSASRSLAVARWLAKTHWGNPNQAPHFLGARYKNLPEVIQLIMSAITDPWITSDFVFSILTSLPC